MSDYTYPVELIKKTKSRIQKQVEGNGLDPKNIDLTLKRQGLGVFHAHTHFTIDSKVETNFTKGKQAQGRLIDSGQSQSEIATFVHDCESDEAIKTQAIEIIKALPLKGFGADKNEIPLGGQKLILSEQTSCGRCQGKGQAQCQTCHGRGQAECVMCHAQGYLQCLHCAGRGEIQNGNQMQICNYCHGKRQVFCTECHGQKQTPCKMCQARGINTCAECKGEGANTTNITITPIIKIASEIFIAELDDEPKIFASNIGAFRLAKGGHIDIKIVEAPEVDDSDIAYYDDKPEDPFKNSVYYEATMPWAVLECDINGKSYKIALAGQKGAVAESKYFMDVLLAYPINILSQAAKGDGFVAGLLKEAAEYRVSRETLSAVIQKGPNKAMADISKLYAIGLSKPTLQGFVKNSYLALKRITRRPRYIGLGIGLVISALINYLWFIDNIRNVNEPFEMTIRYMMDGLPLGLGIIVTIIAIKGAGYFTFQSVMRDLGITSKKMPALGKAGIYGLIGNLVLWGGVFASLLIH